MSRGRDSSCDPSWTCVSNGKVNAEMPIVGCFRARGHANKRKKRSVIDGGDPSTEPRSW